VQVSPQYRHRTRIGKARRPCQLQEIHNAGSKTCQSSGNASIDTVCSLLSFSSFDSLAFCSARNSARAACVAADNVTGSSSPASIATGAESQAIAAMQNAISDDGLEIELPSPGCVAEFYAMNVGNSPSTVVSLFGGAVKTVIPTHFINAL